MSLINNPLNWLRQQVRGLFKSIAGFLNHLSGGKLSPNAITFTGLLAHIPIAYLIADGKHVQAAVLLVVFGLFDTLDGELARLQKRDGPIGMLLDSSTDRMKEIFLYCGVGYSLIESGRPYMAVWAILALGTSILVSYTNAWGEAVMSKAGLKSQVNRNFRGGIMSFEIRIATLIIGLLSGELAISIIVIAIFSWVTVIQRLIGITRKIR